MSKSQPAKYPDCYLHVVECRSGEEYIMPLTGRASLDLKRQIKRWLQKTFMRELTLDGSLMPGLDGEYYGRIMTDGRPPSSAVCWSSGGFFTKLTYV